MHCIAFRIKMQYKNKFLKLVFTCDTRRVQKRERDNKEGRRVFSSVDDVRKDQPGVAVVAKALGESEPSGKTGNQRPHAVKHSATCRRR